MAGLRAARAAAAQALGATVLAECAAALDGALEGQQGSQVRSEVLHAVDAAANQPTAPVVASFIREVEHLRWRSRALDRLAVGFLGQQRASIVAGPANVCSDVNYWIASGYTQVSAETVRFTNEWARGGVAYESELITTLERRATITEKRVLRRIRRAAKEEILHPPIGAVQIELLHAMGIPIAEATTY